jgi:hypothetical protein
MSRGSIIHNTEFDYNSNYLRGSYVIEVSYQGENDPDSVGNLSIAFERYETDEIYECYNAAKSVIDHFFKNDDYHQVTNWDKWFTNIWPDGHNCIYVSVIFYDDEGERYELDDIDSICR